MGFLDDFVKLENGKTFEESLSTIGRTIMERNVAEKAAPLINDYARLFLQRDANGELITGDQVNITNPEQIQAASSRVMMDLLRIPGAQHTSTFKTLAENVTGAAKGQVDAYREVSEGKLRQAQGAKYDADTAEIKFQTEHLNKPITEADLAFFPADAQSYLRQRLAKGESITYREAYSISKIEEPYIRLAIAKMSIGESKELRRKDMFEFRAAYLYPALGPYHTYIKSNENVDEALLSGDTDKVVKAISDDVVRARLGKKATYSNPDEQKIYDDIRNRVSSSFVNFGKNVDANANASKMRAYGDTFSRETGEQNPQILRQFEETYKEVDPFVAEARQRAADKARGNYGPTNPGTDPDVTALEEEKIKLLKEYRTNPTGVAKRLSEINDLLRQLKAK